MSFFRGMGSHVKHWIGAARPKTLPAAAAPAVCATALAFHDGAFAALPAVVCLGFALLVQIGTNFANDYYDFRKGADTKDRVGPTRAVASGLIAPASMRNTAFGVLALAFVVGLTLVAWGGWWLLLVGLASVACAILYTGGPFPIGYKGLGDVFVFLFFGLVAVMFTYYVQAGRFSWGSFFVGAGIGCLSVNLLVVNNYRDSETDARAGKRTLVVRFGRRFSRLEYGLCCLVALCVPLLLVMVDAAGWFVALPLLLAPLAKKLNARLAHAQTKEDYDHLLVGTALFLMQYALLMSIGLAMEKLV